MLSTPATRQHLEARFQDMRPVARFAPPMRGWIRAIREALGMSSAQLARRLKVKQPTVVALEQSELKGTIQLATLRRVAEAMNCTLVYALVPNGSLDAIVRDQALKTARRRLAAIEHSMLLEDQGVTDKDVEACVDALARELHPRALWEDA
jgi:predicted DNA-binding mobile mystery protein A